MLEEAISILKGQNPDIKFSLFLAKDLEKLFFSLNEFDILNLGFNIDSRASILNAYKYLNKVEIELDKENAIFAQKVLENSKDIIFGLNDEKLYLEYEILECRCWIKLEKVNEAKEKYKNLSVRFPQDSRSVLFLAESYLRDGDFDKNKDLLEIAKGIDPNHWLLKLEELLRIIYLGEKTDVAKFNEEEFPEEPREKANFYRLCALIFENSGYEIMADSFIEKAISFTPDKFTNHFVKLSLIEKRLLSNQDAEKTFQESQKLLDDIEKVRCKFYEYGDIGARNNGIINLKKLNALRIQENYLEFEKIAQETFNLFLTCYFDKQVDQIFTDLLMFFLLPDNDLSKLLEYLKNSNKQLSEGLSKALIIQFNIRRALLTEGKKFFKEINNETYFNFIKNLEIRNYEYVLKYLENDTQFAAIFANSLNDFPELRRIIIESLPNDKNIPKDKLMLLLNFDQENFDEAFEILKKIDLTNLSYTECQPILKIIQAKKAWDFEVVILSKLLEKEKDKKEIFRLNLQLFYTYFNLKKYPESIKIGKQLLEQDSVENILVPSDREVLLAHTILVCLERGKVENRALKESKEILDKYQPAQSTFEFKVDIEAEVYLKNNEPNKALESLIEGVKIKKVLTPEQYAKLYILLVVQIGNRIELNLDSLNRIKENTFVKLKNKDVWYFLGNENELDSIKISTENEKHKLFINKILNEKIVFKNKYSSENCEETIEYIFPVKKYILWQVVNNFKKLTQDNVLDGIQRIEVSEKGGTIDLKYLLEFLEDTHKRIEPLFELYCQNNIPLAMLAALEGGLINAIGRIQQENKGFINFCPGTMEDLKKQRNIIEKIIDRETPFYLDGTSALVLSEPGLFRKIYAYLPNLKVSQSVISLLADITEKFRYAPEQTGSMGYAQGKIILSAVEQGKGELIRTNLLETIKLLESNPENISIISSANKMDCFSEQEIPAELSDACILAQKENLPVLTDDFLYLKMNELETKKKSPEYFSSLLLIRVLYEKGKISFDEYLDFFGYLSFYRFRFLPIHVDDIQKAIFGDGIIKTINIRNIRKFNFPLTLAEEYGVSFKTAFTLLGKFLLKVIVDDTVLPDIIERIFIEIINLFPGKLDKKTLGQMFINACAQVVEQNKTIFTSITTKEKIDKLLNIIETYNFNDQLWIPSK